MSSLLDVSALSVRVGGQVLLSDLSFSLGPGERKGLIGESGSGKTVTALAILGLLPEPLEASGSIRLDGREVVGAGERTLVPLRGSVATMVFQEPLTALDPLMRVGRLVAEPIRRNAERHGESPGRKEVRRRVLSALSEVALPEPERFYRSFPHELSGGQRQRVALAMALASRPKLLIADEPTTALDVTIQAEVLRLLNRIITEREMSLLFIGHDLPVVTSVVDEMIVLREGMTVERGETERLLASPQHDYTRSLVEAARNFDAALEAPNE